jgi:ACR3 family arsenite efflux pump ArsB
MKNNNIFNKTKVKKKDKQILIPPIIGLIAAFFTSALLEFALEKYYFPFDPDFGFSFSDNALKYVLLFIPILTVAALFQYFVALKIWKQYKENKKVLYLQLWQLVSICCITLSLIISFLGWYKIQKIEYVTLFFLRYTTFTFSYWFTNYFTMKIIDSFFDNRFSVKNV